ncbi:hypothetical protein [Nocardia implantans]|uniref:DUF8175 domain-containing protein n=1 Tax=Nocardia implantans TaxID=3108168 RepID=A0ABU6B0A5_9NOCA|nr:MULTISPECIES: hypothetical protein [unclassified Nocardia]MEA3530744.1 hypothetical protein [Nocardia sp. CDC192]MEB3513126.1 hypothetical protein [Nocardia sp. CDC186]
MTSTVLRPADSAAWRRDIRRPAAGVVGAALLFAAVGCGGDADSVGPDLSAAPTDVRWQPFQGVPLPHTGQGPRSTADGAATGFEHSPRGAAIAALTHSVRLAVAADTQWAKVAAAEVVPGPAKDEWAINRVQLSITGPAGAEFAPRLLGYKITGYTESRSTVDVYTEYSDRSKAVHHTAVEWFGEDWRLRLPDPDSTDRPIDSIDALPTDIVKVEAPT